MRGAMRSTRRKRHVCKKTNTPHAYACALAARNPPPNPASHASGRRNVPGQGDVRVARPSTENKDAPAHLTPESQGEFDSGEKRAKGRKRDTTRSCPLSPAPCNRAPRGTPLKGARRGTPRAHRTPQRFTSQGGAWRRRFHAYEGPAHADPRSKLYKLNARYITRTSQGGSFANQ